MSCDIPQLDVSYDHQGARGNGVNFSEVGEGGVGLIRLETRRFHRLPSPARSLPLAPRFLGILTHHLSSGPTFLTKF